MARDQKLKIVWKHTHRDYKGHAQRRTLDLGVPQKALASCC
jgi:hypothetical protein